MHLLSNIVNWFSICFYPQSRSAGASVSCEVALERSGLDCYSVAFNAFLSLKGLRSKINWWNIFFFLFQRTSWKLQFRQFDSAWSLDFLFVQFWAEECIVVQYDLLLKFYKVFIFHIIFSVVSLYHCTSQSSSVKYERFFKDSALNNEVVKWKEKEKVDKFKKLKMGRTGRYSVHLQEYLNVFFNHNVILFYFIFFAIFKVTPIWSMS